MNGWKVKPEKQLTNCVSGAIYLERSALALLEDFPAHNLSHRAAVCRWDRRNFPPHHMTRDGASVEPVSQLLERQIGRQLRRQIRRSVSTSHLPAEPALARLGRFFVHFDLSLALTVTISHFVMSLFGHRFYTITPQFTVRTLLIVLMLVRRWLIKKTLYFI